MNNPKRPRPGQEPHALVRNAEDPDQVEEAKNQEELADRRWLEGLRAVLGSPHGRRVIWKILGACGMQEYGFTAERSHYNEGRRYVGGWIQGEIFRTDEDLWGMMVRENQTENAK